MGAVCAGLSLPTPEEFSEGSQELEHCTDLTLTRPKRHFTSLLHNVSTFAVVHTY